jgi:HK97 family phage portal protein
MLQALGLSSVPIEGDPDVPLGVYTANVQPASRAGAGPLTVQRALGLPAVFRAVQLSAGMAAQLVVESWRESAAGDVTLVRPQPGIVRQPDPWRELDSWIERFVVNLATDGNNFTRIHRMPDSSIASLEILNPFTVSIGWKTDRSGRRVKTYTYPDPTTGKRVELKAGDVIHTWFLEVAGQDRSLGPIGHTRAALTGVLDVREYADRWFREEAVDGVLTSDQAIDKPTATQAKKTWYTREPDEPAGPRVRVLGKGLKYEPIMLRPEDAQWIEAQNLGVLDVARIFGLPPEYLAAAVDGTAMTYSNLEMIDAQYLRTTLFPTYLRKIENALTVALPRGQRARFRTSDLLRPDAKTRAEIDAIYLPLGVYGRAEVRTREGYSGPPPTMPATPAPAPKEVTR